MRPSETIYLFGKFNIESFWAWVVAIALTIALALVERTTSYFHESFKHSYPAPLKDHASKLTLYSVSLTARYLLMLIVMSYSITLFSVLIVSMVFGQAIIEVIKQRYAA
ncbi:hypothetical protein DSO57_1016908 [Entomophthora muscae]|uniref:Uncharacterized protein n=1 Tax=Entomophthora muscae TaxID=34485 RepID=A0ACC2T5K9_9FUNG|nr:hypothetical protein DSO57_1016908 [Entomophthora muscae]